MIIPVPTPMLTLYSTGGLPPALDLVLTESGDFALLENGGFILLE
jgi:hypothetical protein